MPIKVNRPIMIIILPKVTCPVIIIMNIVLLQLFANIVPRTAGNLFAMLSILIVSGTDPYS